jgi:NADPH:quinone reductase
MSLVVVATGFGGPEVLSVVDEQVGEPGPGEAVVQIRAAGVNPADVKMYDGTFGRNPQDLPLRLGFEAAGTVVACGPGAVGPAGPVAVGDEVIAFRVGGAYAERLVAPTSALVPRPSELSWEQAAGLMLTGATAVHALTATGVGAGDTVLVHAGAGGVGLMVVQIAAAAGARVIATASETHHDFLRELGAEAVTYGAGLVGRVRHLAPDGVDAAIDAAGTDEAVEASVALVGDRDRIATIAAFQRGREAGIKVLGGGPGADPGTEVRDEARLQLTRLVAAGKLRVFVARAFPLTEVAAAHELILRAHTRGKVVLVP